MIKNYREFLLEKRKTNNSPDWHDSDAPDAKGKFRDLGIRDLAAWLIKTRKGDMRRITGSINQQVVFNRNEDPAYARKMEKVREEVKRQLKLKESQEPVESLAFPSWIKDMEKEGDCKALPFKYVIFFNDEKIREKLEIFYNTGDEKFGITQKGTFFKGKTISCESYREMLNYVKLYMISEKFNNKEIVDELQWVVAKNSDETFGKLADKFYDRILRAEMQLTDEELKALGVTNTTKLGHRYGV